MHNASSQYSTRLIESSVKKQLNYFNLHALPTFTTNINILSSRSHNLRLYFLVKLR